MRILGLGQRKYKVSLERLAVLESEEAQKEGRWEGSVFKGYRTHVFKGYRTYLEKLPMAKSWTDLSNKVKMIVLDHNPKNIINIQESMLI